MTRPRRYPLTSILVLGLLLPMVVGCLGRPSGWYEPHTKASWHPIWGFTLDDTKNNDLKAEGKYNPETKQFEFKVEIENDASGVLDSQLALMQVHTEQMAVYNEQLRIHGQNLTSIAQALNQLAGIVVGGATDILQTTVGPDGLKLGKAAGAPPTSAPPETAPPDPGESP